MEREFFEQCIRLYRLSIHPIRCTLPFPFSLRLCLKAVMSDAYRLIPRSRIDSKSMHGYPYKSKDIYMDIHTIMDIQMGIHKSMDN